jgi:hypothetical protein
MKGFELSVETDIEHSANKLGLCVKYDKSILFISQQLFPCVSTRRHRHKRWPRAMACPVTPDRCRHLTK